MLGYKINNQWYPWDMKTLPNGITPAPNSEQLLTIDELAALGLFTITYDSIPSGKKIVSSSLDDVNGLPHYTYILADADITVPPYVTNFQARAALLQMGYFDLVNDAILNGNDFLAKQAWEYANEVGRYGALTESLAAGFGWSDQILDQLFILASEIEA